MNFKLCVAFSVFALALTLAHSQCGVGEYRVAATETQKNGRMGYDFDLDFAEADLSELSFYSGCLQQPVFMPSPAQTGECVKCPSGSYKSFVGDEFKLCISCPSGMWSLPDGSACACQPGMYLNGEKCMPCGRGRYKTSTANSSTCSVCPTNAIVTDGQCRESCTCPSGFTFSYDGSCVMTSSGRSLQSGTGAAATKVDIKVKFQLNTGSLNSTDNANLQTATVKSNLASSIASNLGVNAADVTVTDVYVCPDASNTKCSGSRLLLQSSQPRQLSSATYLVVVFTVNPTATVSSEQIQSKVKSPTFSSVKTAVATAVSSATSRNITLDNPSATVVSVPPTPVAPKGDSVPGGAIAAVVILFIVAMGGAAYYVKTKEEHKPEELEQHQEQL